MQGICVDVHLRAPRVQAANSEGDGEHSPEVSYRTAKPPPPPPSAVHASASAAGLFASITVGWQAEASGGAAQQYAMCASFEVEAARAGGGPPLHKQNCSAKLGECTLNGVTPGTDFEVAASPTLIPCWLPSPRHGHVEGALR